MQTMTAEIERKPDPDTGDHARWEAVRTRDRRAENRFVFAVQTTGIYCRPGCPSRLPRRENVVFFRDAEAAAKAGFRPCKRCRPEGASLRQRQAQAIADACRLIQEAEEPPSLAALAEATGISRYHFHRLFKEIVGMTPKQYAAAERSERVRQGLTRSSSITEAIFDAGFNTSSRFYESAERTLGMSPTAYRDGGKGMIIRYAVGTSSVGDILVAATDRGVCAIHFANEPDALIRQLRARFAKADIRPGDAAFEASVAQVIAFVEAPTSPFPLPLDVYGTAFQQKVWQALREIPAGETATYGDIADRIGQPTAARAVAQACATNNLAVAIPCHRVVRSDGDLSGYRWGTDRKAALLAREGSR